MQNQTPHVSMLRQPPNQNGRQHAVSTAPTLRNAVSRQVIHAPTVQLIRVLLRMILCDAFSTSSLVPRCAGGNACAEVLIDSQLIVFHLRRLQKTTNLHRPLALDFLCLFGCLLTLFREEFGVITRELLERDEEVSKDDLEAIDVRISGKEAIDERADLRTGIVSTFSTGEDEVLTFAGWGKQWLTGCQRTASGSRGSMFRPAPCQDRR